MGRPNDRNAVVDASAKVIGVRGLRVVDASAFPFLPPGHPMATVCESSDPYVLACSLPLPLPFLSDNLWNDAS